MIDGEIIFNNMPNIGDYFDEELNIFINENKMEYLEKVGLDSGIRKFEKLAFDKVQVPENHTLRPNIRNIKIANQTRGIF